jgi:hypothetical protein
VKLTDPVFRERPRSGLSSETNFLGAGFGDRFEVFRGGSRLFEEGMCQAEEQV